MTGLQERAFGLYVGCMNCGNTTAQCPGVWKDIPGGVPPRGFRFESVPIKILVVGKNPGHPLKGERDRFIGITGTALLNTYREFQGSYYADPDSIREPSNRFHKRLFRYLGFFLDVAPIPATIYTHAAHTNLVKCSTRNERARLLPETMREFFQKYFLLEIEILRPRVLLALGREVERFLRSTQNLHKCPVVYVKHPSYAYRRECEAATLSTIKKEILTALAR